MKKTCALFMIFLGILLFLTSCDRSWIINVDGYILHKTDGKYYIAQLPETARTESIYEVPTQIGEYEIYGFGSDRSLGMWGGTENINFGFIRKIVIKSHIKSVCLLTSNYLLFETEQPISEIKWHCYIDGYKNYYFLSPKENIDVNYIDKSDCYDGIIYEIKDDGNYQVLFNYSKEFTIHNEHKNTIVDEIGDYAFSNSNIKEITIPYNISIIIYCAFRDSLLENVVFNENIVKIGKYAFDNCQLKELNLPNVELEIGNGAFKGNDIKEIVIPENILSLGKEVFQNNDIENFKFESHNITEIPDFMFYSCPLTGNLDYGEYITSIGDNALSFNKRYELIIPDTILYFGDLKYCDNLKTLHLPNDKISIGIFKDLESLEELHLGGAKDLRSLEQMKSVDNLRLITVSDDNQYLYTKDGILYDKKTDAIIKCPPKLEIEKIEINVNPYKYAFSNNIYIKEAIVNCELPEGLFSKCSSLEKVQLNNSIKTIPRVTFFACDSLKEINLNNVVEVGDHAFYSCESLNKVDLSNCEIVNESAFEQCNLYEVIFTSKIKEIKEDAFMSNKNLKKCNYFNATVDKYAFYDTPIYKNNKHIPLF